MFVKWILTSISTCKNVGENSSQLQGCQIVYYHTQKTQFGKILEDLAEEDIGIGILLTFELIYGHLIDFYGHLVNFVVIWYIALILVHCRKKNIATLASCDIRSQSYDRELQRFLIIYNPKTNIKRFANKNIFFYFEKRSSLLQRWRCGCKFRSRRSGSRTQSYQTQFSPYYTYL
jgi:hypothetical protein